ncbi:MAG: heme o synthase [Bacteroidota bacterium]
MKTIAIHSEQVIKVFSFKQKLSDYQQLVKTRLTLLVVFSAVITYFTASHGTTTNWFEVTMLAIGGFLVVASSNGINQIIEKKYDSMMKRTENRPVATNRMSVTEAGIASTLFGIAGVLIIGIYLNQLSGFLALASLISYAFIYTPLKRVSPISVFVGAFPGAIPTLLGWVAFSGHITKEALILFGVQFLWQFPHFWSIAWMLDDDYKRAGFKMLPMYGKDKKSALQILAFTILLVPIGFLPSMENFTGIISGGIAVGAGLVLSYFAFKLFQTCENKDAKKLMFASFLYLPLVQIAFLIDKI